MTCFFKGDFRAKTTTIRGINYVTVSFFDGDKLLFDKIVDLIEQSFRAMKGEEIPNENKLENNVAIEED